MAAASAGLKVFNAFRAGEVEAKGKGSEEEANQVRMKHQKDMLPHFLEALWNASALDIESTLRHVCDKVLHDFSVTAQKRGKRGEALAVLGKIFQQAKAPEGTKDPMAQVEEAMRRAFQPEGEEEEGGDVDEGGVRETGSAS